jgi:glyoxylase-like metal-dependent hydrolase (beta-lactamase superfamily II)
MKIIPLSEGTFLIDKTKLFVPFTDTKDDTHTGPSGSLMVEVQPFVVVTDKDVLLLDTGLGFSDEKGKMQIHTNLAKEGIKPNDITKVLLTHLHKDHAGGVSKDPDHLALTFPKATYYIQERELSFALQKGLPSFVPEELELLKNSDRVEWLKNDEGFIDEYIEYKVTAAHSPYHQVFWIRENGKIIFFGGDDAPQSHQMKHRFIAKYDHDGRKAMELRKDWWETGKVERWTFLFYHDIRMPVVASTL